LRNGQSGGRAGERKHGGQRQCGLSDSRHGIRLLPAKGWPGLG
jgi:hypothetical protein